MTISAHQKKQSLGLDNLSNQPLRQRIADLLRTAICTGKLKPNTAIIESDIAAQLGVSRAPIREAVQILNKEGLLQTTPYKGTIVKIITREDIEEIYSLRSELESFAIRLILRNDMSTALTHLEGIYAQMLQATQNNDRRTLNVEDAHFHRALIELAKHSLLLEHWNLLFARVQQILSLRNLQNEDLVQIANNHIPILNSIKKRDSEQAEQLIRIHVESAGDLAAIDWEAGIASLIGNE